MEADFLPAFMGQAGGATLVPCVCTAGTGRKLDPATAPANNRSMTRYAPMGLQLAAALLSLGPLSGACATAGQGDDRGPAHAPIATVGAEEQTAEGTPPGVDAARAQAADPGATTAGGEAPAAEAPVGAAATRLPSPPPALPAEVHGGTIARTALQAVLAQGVGRFLQRVRVEAQRSDGRFEGWRLHALFESEPALREASLLRPGDLVLRVNNHSVQRPEQFLAVWESLATAGEINIDVVRGGQPSRVRYQISD